MKKPIQISIPTPCHENWDAMAPETKGRFCASCQKKVFDFTNSTDREIASVLKNAENACGRFRTSQLNRDLVIPKEKSSLWMAASAAVVSFLTVGIQESIAQQTNTAPKITYSNTKNKKKKPNLSLPEITLEGKIIDSDSSSIPGVNIRIIRTNKVVQTDIDGNFKLDVHKNDRIEISYTGMLSLYFIITGNQKLIITLEQDTELASCIDIQAYRTTRTAISGGAVIVQRTIYAEQNRTFFGRIFHSIGNLFR